MVSGWGLRARMLGEEPEEAVEAWLCAMTAQMMIYGHHQWLREVSADRLSAVQASCGGHGAAERARRLLIGLVTLGPAVVQASWRSRR